MCTSFGLAKTVWRRISPNNLEFMKELVKRNVIRTRRTRGALGYLKTVVKRGKLKMAQYDTQADFGEAK